MKGVSLPIEVLVIVVVVVIVLLGLIAVYFTGWTPFSGTMGIEGVKGVACRKLILGSSCEEDPVNIAITDVEGINNFQELCDTYYGSGGDADACKAVCGCGGVISIGVGNGGAVCGNNIREGSEQCDGTDDAACPGGCIAAGLPNECTCPSTCTGGEQNGEFGCDCTSRTACP